MLIAIVHNAVPKNAPPEELDVLEQAEAITGALRRLGYSSCCVPCTLDLAALRRRLQVVRPDVVFNLVENLDGYGCLIHVAPSLFDVLGLPYTGTLGETLFITSHKLLAKNLMRAAGIPTPPWIEAAPNNPTLPPREPPRRRFGSYIIKSVREHASFGLEDRMVVRLSDPERIRRKIRRLAPRLQRELFAEAYIEGREFNVSVLACPDGPLVLPLAEIEFPEFPAEKPRIVGYQAKWAEGSFEYEHTPRCFEFPAGDRPLLKKLRALALKCFNFFCLRGYARVDIRVDRGGRPWILEINANPCLSPEGGFASAVARAGKTYDSAIQAIVDDARQPRGWSRRR